MPTFRPDPMGGFLVTRDDGTSFRSAMPVGSPASAGMPPPAIAAPAPTADFDADSGQYIPAPDTKWQEEYNRRSNAVQFAKPEAAQDQGQSGAGGASGDQGASGNGMQDAAPPPMQAPQPGAVAPQPGAGAPQGGAVFAKPAPAMRPGQLPPGYYTTKAGWMQRGKTEQQREVPQEQRDQIDYAFQSQAAAQQYGAAVGGAQAAQDFAAKQAYADQARAIEAQNQLREQQRQQAIQQQMDKVQATAADVASQKIDREAVWGKGGRELGAIALAIGAFVQTRGGPNAPQALINKAMDDSLKEQEANLANKRAGLEAQNTILGQMRQQFGDERSSYLAAKAVMTDDLARRIEVTAAKYKAPQIAANAQLAVADLRKQYAGLMTELHQTTSAISSVYDPGGLHGGPGKVNEADVKHLDTELRKEKIPDAYASLSDADRILDKSKGDDIAGLGKGKSWAVEHVPGASMALSDEGMANRQALERAVVAVAHATGRVTPAEVDVVRSFMTGDGSVRAIRNGLQWGRSQLQNVDRSVRASVPEAAQGEYVRRGGLAMPDYSGATQVTPAGSQ